MRPAHRRLVPLIAGMAAFALVAGLAPTVRAADASVQIADMAFAPGDVTVSVGDTVTWTNADPMVHTVTSTTGAFDSGALGEGESFSVTFTASGTYAYLCTPHPFMTATVTVVAAPSAPLPNVAMPSPPGGPVSDLALAGLVLVVVAVAIGAGSRVTRAAERRAQRPD